jgi:ComF family protein
MQRRSYLGAMPRPLSTGAIFNKVVHPLGQGAGSVVGLFLPLRCAGCDDALLAHERSLCLKCAEDLPLTRFHHDPGNPVERIFWGRLELASATAFLHFDKRGMVQHMLHRLKYKGDRAVGLELGRRMGREWMASPRFNAVERIIAVPLHPRKERQRGYNQSQVLVDGMREVWGLPAAGSGLLRVVRTPSQTRKGRLGRWLNVKDAFEVPHVSDLEGRHVLLVDDVVTTGATLEACATALLRIPGVRVSIATVAFA